MADHPSHPVAPQRILNEPGEILSVKGVLIPCKMSVDNVSFSAHVDYSQNAEFIELVDPEHLASELSLFARKLRNNFFCQVLVHGEKTTMGRFCAAMEARYEARGIDRKIYTPGNLETLELSIRSNRTAQVRFLPPILSCQEGNFRARLSGSSPPRYQAKGTSCLACSSPKMAPIHLSTRGIWVN